MMMQRCFNADPHPGNILCVDGKLALIDYGQVKRMTKKQRLDTCKSYILVDAAIKVDPRVNPNVRPEVHERAKHCIATHAFSTGMKTKKMREQTAYEMVSD
jgi:hypothetical protein